MPGNVVTIQVDEDLNAMTAEAAVNFWEKLNEEIPENEIIQREKPKTGELVIVPKRKGKQLKLDDGKILALRKAGWTYAKIADEMGCSIQTVVNHLSKGGRK